MFPPQNSVKVPTARAARLVIIPRYADTHTFYAPLRGGALRTAEKTDSPHPGQRLFPERSGASRTKVFCPAFLKKSGQGSGRRPGGEGEAQPLTLHHRHAILALIPAGHAPRGPLPNFTCAAGMNPALRQDFRRRRKCLYAASAAETARARHSLYPFSSTTVTPSSPSP